MFNLIDTRDNTIVAKVANNAERKAWLNAKKIGVQRWATYQMRRAS